MQFFWKHLHSNKGDENVSKLIWIVIAFVIGALMLSTLSVAFKTNGVIDNWLNDSIESWFGEPENRDGSTGGSGAGGSGPSGGGNNNGNPNEPVNASLENIVMQYDASIGALTTDNDKNNGTSYTALFTDLSLNSVYEASAYRSTEGSNTVGSSFLLGNTTGIINQSEVNAQYKDMFKEGTKVITAEDPSGNTYYIGVDEDGNVICPMPSNPVNDGEYVVFTAEDKTPIVLTWDDTKDALVSSGKDYTDMFKGLTEGLMYSVSAYPSASNGSNVDETYSVLGEEHAVAEPAVDPYKSGTMMLTASNGVTTGVDTSGNILVMKAARPSTGNAVYSQGTDGFENTIPEEDAIVHNGSIPEGGVYYVGVSDTELNDFGYNSYSKMYCAGEQFPTPKQGDIYVFGDYEYRYHQQPNDYNFDGTLIKWGNDRNEWGVRVINSEKSEYGTILTEINNKPIKKLYNTFSSCKNMQYSPTIPNTVKIMDSTFYNCTSLIKMPVIPYGVENMTSTFRECSNLTKVTTIPNSVTSVNSTFYGCSSLKAAPEMPSSVTSMNSTFGKCSALIYSPTIPNSVTNMNGTFYGCKELEIAPKLSNKTENLSLTFFLCEKLKVVPAIPYGVKILEETFSKCYALEQTPEFPNSITDMKETFRDCLGLTTVLPLSNSLTNMEEAFFNCSKLTNIPAIPNSVVNMNSTFRGCNSLTTIPVIPENVTNMDYVFYSCPLEGVLQIMSPNVSSITEGISRLSSSKITTVIVPADSQTYTTLINFGLPNCTVLQTF